MMKGSNVLEQEIGQQVMGFMRENFLFDDTRSLGEEESLIGSGVIDSTGILELISFLEKQFHVSFDDQELVAENFDSVKRIKSFLSRKMATNGGSNHAH